MAEQKRGGSIGMRTSLFESRFEEVKRLPPGDRRDRLLMELLYDMEREFDIPIFDDPFWERTNWDVWELYLRVSDARRM